MAQIFRVSQRAAQWAPTPPRPTTTIELAWRHGLVLLPLPGNPHDGTGLAIKIRQPPTGHLAGIKMGNRRGTATILSLGKRCELVLLEYTRGSPVQGEDVNFGEGSDMPDTEWELKYRMVELDGEIEHCLFFDEQSGRAVIDMVDRRRLVVDFA